MTDDHRRRSRRRGDALTAAIFEAALEELTENGYVRFAMDRVAERASASKASLYRRWPSRIELVMDAVYDSAPLLASPADTGSLRGDLVVFFRALAAWLEGPAGEAMRGLLSDVLSDPERGKSIRGQARGAGKHTMRIMIDRAIARGEVDASDITERRMETGHALLRYEFLFRGAPIADSTIDEIVDEVMLPLLAPGQPVP